MSWDLQSTWCTSLPVTAECRTTSRISGSTQKGPLWTQAHPPSLTLSSHTLLSFHTQSLQRQPPLNLSKGIHCYLTASPAMCS